ncbi:UNVERIFIED_CONTAM: hypothetical protein FKN15_022050 [Acipenser sinensis]
MSDFDRRLIVGARMAQITHYSRGTVSKVMMAWKNMGKMSSAKHSGGRRRHQCEWDRRALINRDCCQLSSTVQPCRIFMTVLKVFLNWALISST